MFMKVIYVIPSIKIKKEDISVEISYETYRIYVWMTRFCVINLHLDLCWKYIFQQFVIFICFMHCWIFEYSSDGQLDRYRY